MFIQLRLVSANANLGKYNYRNYSSRFKQFVSENTQQYLVKELHNTIGEFCLFCTKLLANIY